MTDNTHASRPRSFLVARDTSVVVPAGVGSVDFDWIVEQLHDDPRVQVERDLSPRTFRAQTLGTSVTDRIVVAAMPEELAEELRTHPQLLVEEDLPLNPHVGVLSLAAADPGVLSPFGTGGAWRVRLVDAEDRPVPGATVYLYGTGVPAQGRTDAAGEVTLSLVSDTSTTLRALYANPTGAHWSLWLANPELTEAGTTTVKLSALAESFAGFPAAELLGWGQRAMRLDRVPATMRGAGVRVAVVDSGAAAATHPDLANVFDGIDLTVSPSSRDEWRTDTIAHGSHCTGIISGTSNGGGVRGFAPDATVLQAKIFPGGRLSSLVDAIDFCVAEEIDVVNLSLGTGGSSPILLQKIAQAKELGVACIVAAGNTGGGVQFPGISPDVLTVAAMGQEGTFPETSYHAQQRLPGGREDQGFFAAKFSCHGPEIDVCGPGVAIVSAVPTQEFAAWDGTSMATPHITGLAALVLAHHADFAAGPFALRGAARVDRLFEILKQSATALAFGDPERSGAGLPDAPRALGLEAGPGRSSAPAAGQRAEVVGDALARVAILMRAAGLGVTPAAAPPADTRLVRRGLSELQARMAQSGLPVGG